MAPFHEDMTAIPAAPREDLKVFGQRTRMSPWVWQ